MEDLSDEDYKLSLSLGKAILFEILRITPNVHIGFTAIAHVLVSGSKSLIVNGCPKEAMQEICDELTKDIMSTYDNVDELREAIAEAKKVIYQKIQDANETN